MRMRMQSTKKKNVRVRYGKTVKRMAITTILTWESVLIWCAILFYGIDSKNALPKWKIIRQVIATALVITVVMAWLCGVFGVFTRNRNLVGAAIGMSIPQLAAMIGMLMIFAKWRISIKAEDYIDWVHCVVLLAGFFLLIMKVWGTAILYTLINKRKWCFDGISLKRMSLFLCMVWELATIVMSAMVNHEQVKLEKIGKSVDSMQTMCTILNWGFRIMIIVAFLSGVFGLVAKSSRAVLASLVSSWIATIMMVADAVFIACCFDDGMVMLWIFLAMHLMVLRIWSHINTHRFLKSLRE